jgi:hypothetical protein
VVVIEGYKENCSDLAVTESLDNTRRLSEGHSNLPRSLLNDQIFNNSSIVYSKKVIG